MSNLLLDTHIALWLDSGHERLRATTRALIDRSWKSGKTIFLSAVSAWEIALLVDKGKIDLDLPAPSWIKRFLERPGIEAVPLRYGPASRSYQLHHLVQRDPADRLLVATAIELNCPLVTYDPQIVEFAETHGKSYKFSVAH
jgi:PIN domain nuclease of toxin-antitoxin system